MIKILIVFIVSCNWIYAIDKIENVYILIEPTVIANRLDDKGKEINDILKASERMVRDIIEFSYKNKIKKIILNDGYNQVFLTKKDKAHREVRRFFKKRLYKKHRYNIGKILGRLSSNIVDGLSAKNTILVYIGDINFVDNGISSHAGYLNGGWLNNKNSIFVKYFLKQDNTNLKNMKIFIVNRTQLRLEHEKRRKDFIVKLFNLADMKVCLLTNTTRNFPASVKSNYITSLFKDKLKSKTYLTSAINMDTSICQIVAPREANVNGEINVNGCGGN